MSTTSTIKENGATAIDIFAGCGGGTLGFKNAGYDVKAAVEIAPKACLSYSMNHPEVNLIEHDVRLLDAEKILKTAGLRPGETTVLLGCPPCQGFSTLSKVGGEDSRNSLVWRFMSLVTEILPEFVVFENVPGLKIGVGKLRWARAKGLLERAGYYLVEEVIDAAAYGVPQFRKRLLLIASKHGDSGLSIPAATYSSPEVARKKGLLSWTTVRSALEGLPHLSTDQLHSVDHLHCAPIHREIVLERLRHIPHDGGGRKSLPEALVLKCHKTHSGHWDVYGRIWWDRPAPTLTTGCTNVTRGRFAHPEEDRAITLREAARLQTFPDSYCFAGSRGEIASQIGNAVPPLLATLFGKHILSIRKAH